MTLRDLARRLALSSALLLAVPAAAGLDPYTVGSSRYGDWDAAFTIKYLNGESYGADGGTSLKTNEDVSFGFWFGNHVSENFAWEGGFDWASVGYNATIANADTPALPDTKLGGTMEAATMYGMATYHFLRGPITPYVTGGVGWTWIDSNIPTGPSTGTCWWDPWWGYVCGTWQPTATSSDFSYRYGVGVRWQVNRSLFVRFSYVEQVMELSSHSESPAVGAFKLDIGGSR
jgi:opacity protein-like surface antigen